jgi:redox-sensitive bicupin YhaK (pirin superfamily)
MPERTGIQPSYEQKKFDPIARQNRLQLVASRDASDDSLLIHQDTKIYLADLHARHEITYDIPNGRHVWIQVLRGDAIVNGQLLHPSDAAAISNERLVRLKTESQTEIMLFDLL